MFTVKNIHISFVGAEEESVQETGEATRGSYSVDIQAGESWVVIGKYREDSLCALELKRISQSEAKE